MPQKRGWIFVGRGFEWTRVHTQRIAEVRKKLLTRGTTSRSTPRSANAAAEHDRNSGRPELHGVELHERDAWLGSHDRTGHTLVLGTTRVGKTRLAELLITQDIHRGATVIVLDPKGDVDLLCRVYAEAERAGRANAFQFFHLGFPQWSSRYNAIGRFSRVTEVATRIANQLPSQGNSAAFKEFAWRFVNIIANALVALDQTPNYGLIRKYINDIEPLFVKYSRHSLLRRGPIGWASEVKREARSISQKNLPPTMRGRDPEAVALMRYLQKNEIDDPVLEGLVSSYKYDRTYFDKIVSSVGPLMEKLTTGAIGDLISPHEDAEDEYRQVFEWLDLIKSNGVIYVGLDALTDSTVAAAIGNSMFADLVSVAGHIYKHGIDDTPHVRPDVAIHADEFNELIGDEFVPLLNKAGGAGFQVTAYTQTWSDVEAGIGSKAKSGQVAGNFNTMIMMRVRELATADLLTELLPKVSVLSLATSSGVGDSSKPNSEVDFESSNSDQIARSEAPLVDAADIFALPRGHAFVYFAGGQLWKIRIPLLAKNDRRYPKSVAEVFARTQGERAKSESEQRTPADVDSSQSSKAKPTKQAGVTTA